MAKYVSVQFQFKTENDDNNFIVKKILQMFEVEMPQDWEIKKIHISDKAYGVD